MTDLCAGLFLGIVLTFSCVIVAFLVYDVGYRNGRADERRPILDNTAQGNKWYKVPKNV